MFSTTSIDPCACCDKKCFQQWGASWDCDTSSWTLTPGPKQCFTTIPFVGWQGTGCSGYTLWYLMGHACAVDGDCADLPDTPTPEPPFPGIPPTCCCCQTCALDPDPGCCAPCPTPNQIRVTIVAATASPKCTWDTANHFHVHRLDVSLLVGRTFILPFDPGPLGTDCCWKQTFDVTAWVRLLQCIGDGTGCVCTPTADVTAHSEMTITHCAGGGLTFDFHMTSTDTELDNNPDGFEVSGSDMSSDVTPVPCCNGWTASGPGPDGGEDWNSVFITSAVVIPC